MCDYSLMNIPNRLANVGEELITHSFSTGALGLASPADLPRPVAGGSQKQGWWVWLKQLFSPERCPVVPAVCIPPGSRLLLRDIPRYRQERWRVQAVEEVAFTQVTAATATFRDAVCFTNGCQVLFQELSEGQRVRVLDMSSHDPADMELQDERPRVVHARGRDRAAWRSPYPLGSPLRR